MTIIVAPIASSPPTNRSHGSDTVRPLVLSRSPACSDSVKTTLCRAKLTTALKRMHCRDAFDALLASFGAVPRIYAGRAV